MCPSPFKINDPADFPTRSLYGLSLAIQYPSRPTLLRHPFTQTSSHGTGIFNLFSIAYSNWPRLRYRLTLSGWTVLTETLDFRRTEISSVFSLLIPTSSLLWASTCPYGQACISQRTLPYPKQKLICVVAASVICLVPFILQCKDTWPVSYYAFFKWWLPPSPHPGCLCVFTSFIHLANILGP